MPTEVQIYCTDLRKVLPYACCDSCHEDHESYGYSLCERQEDAVLLLGCCGSVQALDGKTPEAVAALFRQALATRPAA